MISPEYGSSVSPETRTSLDLGRGIGRVELIGFNAAKAQEVAAEMLAKLYPAPTEKATAVELVHTESADYTVEVPQAA